MTPEVLVLLPLLASAAALGVSGLRARRRAARLAREEAARRTVEASQDDEVLAQLEAAEAAGSALAGRLLAAARAGPARELAGRAAPNPGVMTRLATDLSECANAETLRRLEQWRASGLLVDWPQTPAGPGRHHRTPQEAAECDCGSGSPECLAPDSPRTSQTAGPGWPPVAWRRRLREIAGVAKRREMDPESVDLMKADLAACGSASETMSVISNWHDAGHVFTAELRRMFILRATSERIRGELRRMFNEQDR